jgi:hypothetical protein
VGDDLQLLGVVLARKRTDDWRRMRLEAEIALQERRVAWLEAAGSARDRELLSRQREIERDLGEEGLGYLAHGLPEERRRDQRFLDLLAELAIIRFALGGK